VSAQVCSTGPLTQCSGDMSAIYQLRSDYPATRMPLLPAAFHQIRKCRSAIAAPIPATACEPLAVLNAKAMIPAPNRIPALKPILAAIAMTLRLFRKAAKKLLVPAITAARTLATVSKAVSPSPVLEVHSSGVIRNQPYTIGTMILAATADNQQAMKADSIPTNDAPQPSPKRRAKEGGCDERGPAVSI
jgi:hypothetical protein